MKKFVSIIFLFLLFCLKPAIGQSNNDLTQWNRYLLNQNPAYAGYNNFLSAGLVNRSQWVGMETSGAPVNQLLEVQTPLKKPGIALGFSYNHYAIGRLNENDLMLSYAYRIIHRNYTLSMGLALGFTYGKREFAILEDDAADPAFSDDGKSYFIPNAGFGIAYYTKTYHVGLSIPRLLSQQSSSDGGLNPAFDITSMLIRATAGADINLSRDMLVSPNLLVKYGVGWLFQASVGLDATLRETFLVGLGYRTSEAVYLKLGYKLNQQFSAMYSYDFLHTSEVVKRFGGSHEIGIVYHFGYTVVSSSPRDF